MKINQDLLAGVREAMSLLQRDGPVSATAKIQQTLRDLTPAVAPGAESTETPTGPFGAARRERNITPVDRRREPAPIALPGPAGRASPDAPATGRAAAADPTPAVSTGPAPPASAPTSPFADGSTTGPDNDGAPATGEHRRLIPDLLARLGIGSKHGEARHEGPTRRSRAKGQGADKLGADVLGPGEFLAGSYSNQAGTRDYRLYVPTTHRQSPPTAGTALVVLLHGCSQTPVDFAAGTRFNLLAEGQPCLVLYPAQTRKANITRCWNWFRPADQQRGDGEPALIAGMTRQVIDTYGIDPARVFIAGLSAGGAMALTMINTYPELYAAVGVHSGVPYAAASDVASALAAMRGSGDRGTGGLGAGDPGAGDAIADASPTGGRVPARPIILFHGDRDQTVHPDNAARIVAQSRPAAGTTETHQDQADGGHAYTRNRHQDANGRLMVEAWTLHGAGHAWSGGSSHGTFTDGRGPDASRAMLRFFMAATSDGQREV